MPRMIITRAIDAPIALVFKTVSDINQFAKAVPGIVKVEFLSDVTSGVGARFRETRLMKGKEMTNDLEVTEHVENDRVRIVADTAGTVWDTLFAVKSEGGRTVLTMTMDAKARTLAARLANLLIFGMVRKEVEKDMDAVKVFCER